MGDRSHREWKEVLYRSQLEDDNLYFPHHKDGSTFHDSHGFGEDFVTNYVLPAGWEVRETDSGRKYYVDHFRRSTSWILPLKVLQVVMQPLPIGWERRLSEKGTIYSSITILEAHRGYRHGMRMAMKSCRKNGSEDGIRKEECTLLITIPERRLGCLHVNTTTPATTITRQRTPQTLRLRFRLWKKALKRIMNTKRVKYHRTPRRTTGILDQSYSAGHVKHYTGVLVLAILTSLETSDRSDSFRWLMA